MHSRVKPEFGTPNPVGQVNPSSIEPSHPALWDSGFRRGSRAAEVETRGVMHSFGQWELLGQGRD